MRVAAGAIAKKLLRERHGTAIVGYVRRVGELEATIDDPRTYTRPWKSTWTLSWVPGEEMPYFLCQDNRP